MADILSVLIKCPRCKQWGATIDLDKPEKYYAHCDNCRNAWWTSAAGRINAAMQDRAKAESRKRD